MPEALHSSPNRKAKNSGLKIAKQKKEGIEILANSDNNLSLASNKFELWKCFEVL